MRRLTTILLGLTLLTLAGLGCDHARPQHGHRTCERLAQLCPNDERYRELERCTHEMEATRQARGEDGMRLTGRCVHEAQSCAQALACVGAGAAPGVR